MFLNASFFIHLFLAVLGHGCCSDCSPVGVCRLLTERVLQLQSTGSRAHGLRSCGSLHGLSCPEACGILADQESIPHLLHGQADSLSPGEALKRLLIVLILFYCGKNI